MDINGKHNNHNKWLKFMKLGEFFGCHQRADRSFFIRGKQLPVCARCTGVIISQLIALILIWFVKVPFYICCVLVVPMLIDWSIQFFKLKESTNVRRVITGFLAGFGLTYIYYYIIRFFIHLFF